jgi:2-dehydro-3-deoxygalactonokinase
VCPLKVFERIIWYQEKIKSIYQLITPAMENFLLGCDWGTSSFRLRLIQFSTQHQVGEIVSNEGIATMHKKWTAAQETGEFVSKGQLYQHYLETQIRALSQNYSLDLNDVPIVISGMASSSIGLEELPYARVPFALDGTTALIRQIDADINFPHDIMLVSGVRSETDVLRGEETQLIGLMELLSGRGKTPGKGIFIFPGTHSKHIYVEGGMLVNFRTFMTGELFSIISNYSILKDSIVNDTTGFAGIEEDAFISGVRDAGGNSILNGLFTVRTNQLFGRWGKKQNGSYLSGLLIGEEMKYLLEIDEWQLILCSSENLSGFYKLALDTLNLAGRTTIIPPSLVDLAALSGQILIFRKHQKGLTNE